MPLTYLWISNIVTVLDAENISAYIDKDINTTFMAT